MTYKPLTTNADDYIQRYIAGESMQSLNREFGITYGTGKATLMANGIHRRGHREAAFRGDMEKAITAYISGRDQIASARIGRVDDMKLSREIDARGLRRTKKQSFLLSGRMDHIAKHQRSVKVSDDVIRDRYLAGETVWGLAKALNTSRQTIYTSLKFTETPLRTNEEVVRLRSSNIPLNPRKPVFNDQPDSYVKTFGERCLTAQQWQDKAAIGEYSRDSESERIVAAMLEESGLRIICQQAIGPYNVDIGIHPVAVEIWGGAWHFSKDHSERFHYLLNRGWSVAIIYVDSRTSPIGYQLGKHIAAYAQELSANPSRRGEYRVVWGSGEAFSTGRLDDDNVANIVPRKSFLDSRAAD